MLSYFEGHCGGEEKGGHGTCYSRGSLSRLELGKTLSPSGAAVTKCPGDKVQ